MNTEARLKQIEKIAQNARSTWFGLLGLLVFVGITLMGHKDADFFAYGASTKLPIVGIQVPTTYFFLAAPILTSAVYCYLHVFLFSLWEALGNVEQEKLGRPPPLSERVYPMIFTVAALWYRNQIRQDGSMGPRLLGRWTLMIALLLGWALGPLVLGLLWWRSMPVHDVVMTLVAGAALWAALSTGLLGLILARDCLAGRGSAGAALARSDRIMTSVIALVVISAVSVERATLDRFGFLATADLREAQLTERPREPLDHTAWWTAQLKQSIAAKGLEADPADWPHDVRQRVFHELADLWAARMQSLNAPTLRGRDLRGADLRGAFLAGADLRDAVLDGARLVRADLQGADLRKASLGQVDMTLARLQAANLAGARIENADLGFALMADAVMIETRLVDTEVNRVDLSRADLRQATLSGLWFERANLADADLHYARSDDVGFNGSRLDRVVLSGMDLSGMWFQNSNLTGADLSGATLSGADFTSADLGDARLNRSVFDTANLAMAKLDGADVEDWSVKGASLIGVDLGTVRNLSPDSIAGAFGDSDTRLPAGVPQPCHWTDEETFMGGASSSFAREETDDYIDRTVWETSWDYSSASMHVESDALEAWKRAGRPILQRDADGACPSSR